MPSVGSAPLSVLDLAPVSTGATVGDALRNSLDLAQHVERLGYLRHWVAEHHNMPGIASSAPAVLIAHLASVTTTIRVGSGGVMLPNHQPLVVAEQFGMLEALHPGRIDLGVGRAPGTDPITAHALRRSADPSADDLPHSLPNAGPALRHWYRSGPRRATHERTIMSTTLGGRRRGEGVARQERHREDVVDGRSRDDEIQPELWVDNPSEAVAFYQAAFGVTVLHRVGHEDDIVAQLGVGDAAFWVAGASAAMKRLSPAQSTAPRVGRCSSSMTRTESSARQ
jgi:Luciferase-like monooxygenase